MSHYEEKRKIGDQLKEEILRKLVEPSYYIDVNETLKGRKCWRVSGHVFESFSKILLAVSSVLSFAAGVYDDKVLSFIAGTLSTTSLACFQFSLYSMRMHKKNSLELNQLLEKIDIEGVPIFGSMRESDPAQQYEQYSEPSLMCRQVSTEEKRPVQIITEVYKQSDLPDEQKESEYSHEKSEKSESTPLIEMQVINKNNTISPNMSTLPIIQRINSFENISGNSTNESTNSNNDPSTPRNSMV